MNEIKMICLDLDGTLLNSQKQISERNLQALRECAARGIEIVPTTGRIMDGIPLQIKELPGVRYGITTNGAAIVNFVEGKVLDKREIDYEKAIELLTFIAQYPIMYDPYINGRGITEGRFLENMETYGIPKEIQELIRTTRDVVPNIIEYVKEHRCSVEKINLFFREPEVKKQMREKLAKFSDIIITSAMPCNLEINHPEATKGQAIVRLASLLGLEKNETMAFGDGENDFSMMEEAGIGVAMANGMEGLKAAADYVTVSNDEDGVWAAINYFILGQR